MPPLSLLHFIIITAVDKHNGEWLCLRRVINVVIHDLASLHHFVPGLPFILEEVSSRHLGFQRGAFSLPVLYSQPSGGVVGPSIHSLPPLDFWGWSIRITCSSDKFL